MSDVTAALPAPSLGEWACLGILYGEPAHGWAVARRLRPDGDIGRIWTLSRGLTYRSLDQLAARGWVQPIAEEPGDAGPNRTILAATRRGRARFRTWVATPVDHLRDLRSELLLKLVFADRIALDTSGLLAAQAVIVDRQAERLAGGGTQDGPAGRDHDVVALWRIEATAAAQRFIARLSSSAIEV